MENNEYLVYGHYNDKNELKYVGFGNKNRPYDFKKRSEKWLNYFSDKKPTVKIFFENLTEKEAKEKEKQFILKYKNQLLNSTNGIGFGGNTYKNKTNEELKEIKNKISKKLKENNGNKGQYIGSLNPMFGKKSPSRKKITIQNMETKEIITFNTREESYLFLKKYMTKKEFGDFIMGRLTNVDKYCLKSIEQYNKIQTFN